MAAIIPFLERQDDPAETKILSAELALPAKVAAEAGTVETMAARVGARVIARGTFGDLATEGLTAEALNQTHAELVNTAWIRKVVEDQLVGQTYTIEREGRHTRIVLAKEIGPSPAWNPPANPENRRFKVLSWTSKMAAPSFSLPAGPLEAGGACPGATAGQSIVPVDALLPAARRVRAVTGEPVRLQQAICNFCYAEGGQYSTGQVQFAQVLRYVWARQAARDVRFEGSRAVFGPVATAWCRAMIEAIDSAEYRLDGREKKGEDGEPTVVLLPERHEGRFFRIHDSGDFFSKQYLAMWKAITNALPGIRFWAPTRIWATSWGVDAVNEINGPAEASNLIIRPSAYHVQEAPVPRAKLGQGWSSGSSAIHKDVKQWARAAQRFDWDCQTYAVDDEKHTCRHAIAPDGKTGCRACWERTDLRINYTLH